MRDFLCALPRNDPSREARNGRVLGRKLTFDRERESGKFHAGRARFLWRTRNGTGSAGKTGKEERVRVVGTGVSSVTGRSGERSWAGGMITND